MLGLLISLRFPRRAVLAAVVGSVSLILAGLFVYEVYAQPLSAIRPTTVTTAPAGTVNLGPSSHAAAVTPAADTPIAEIHIASTGLTYLRGARVASVSGSTIRTEISLGAGTFSWNIETGYNTQFYGQNGAKEALTDIKPGVYISITGKLSSAGSDPSLSADIVRNQ